MEVGGYLTRSVRIAASIALNDESSVSQSLTNVGIEMLSQQQNLSCAANLLLIIRRSALTPFLTYQIENIWDVSLKVGPVQNNFLLFPLHDCYFYIAKGITLKDP